MRCSKLPWAGLAVFNSLITFLVIGCGGSDTPTATAVATPAAQAATSAATPLPGSEVQPATSTAVSGLQPTAVAEQPATAAPLATAAAASKPATPPATAGPTATLLPSPVMADSGGGISMGGSALGGNAETVLLAQQVLKDLPAGDLVWATYETRLEAGDQRQLVLPVATTIFAGHIW